MNFIIHLKYTTHEDVRTETHEIDFETWEEVGRHCDELVRTELGDGWYSIVSVERSR